MTSAGLKIRIPTSRIIANAIATGIILVIAAGLLYAIGNILPNEEWTWTTSTRGRTLHLGFDAVRFEFGPPIPVTPHKPDKAVDSPSVFNILGVEYSHPVLEWRSDGVRWRGTTVGFPWWPFAIIWFVRPLFLSLGRMDEKQILNEGQRRARQGRLTHCKICGYDLRATPDRCPECGTIPQHDSSISREE